MKKLVIYLFFLTLIFPVAVFAEEPVLNNINEIPGINQIRKKQPVQIGEYNGSGLIDQVHEKVIVLNDSILKLSSSLEIFNLNGSRISRKLEKGQYVYYFLNQNHEIIKIYIED